jgi:predicted transcriptional regulator
MAPYRNSVKILGDVLKITEDYGTAGVNLTSLLRKANLSYGRLAAVAGKLIQAGLIQEHLLEGQRMYIITPQGREYLRRYIQFAEMTNSFGLNL